MAGKTRYSVRQVREAIEGSRGNKSTIAEKLGCTRQTVDNLLLRFPELVPMLEQERESLVDKAENKLNDLLDANEPRAVFFVLETLGKNRGWAKRTEITGKDGEGIGLSKESLDLMARNGVSVADVVREFEAMMKAQLDG